MNFIILLPGTFHLDKSFRNGKMNCSIRRRSPPEWGARNLILIAPVFAQQPRAIRYQNSDSHTWGIDHTKLYRSLRSPDRERRANPPGWRSL